MSYALYCMLFGILVFSPETDAGELTWTEPPPIQTVQDDNLTDHLSKKELRYGKTNATMRWHFALTGLDFDSLIILFEGQVIAGVRSSAQGPQPGFENQYGINWVASQKLITLFIFSVTNEVDGIFTCRVNAVKGVATFPFSSNVKVDVVVSPSITEITGGTVIEGGSVTLNCSVKGKPPPSITWTRLSDNRNVTMPLINFSRHDAREYRCTAENGVGIPATENVIIDVQYPPEDNGTRQNPTLTEGDKHTFSCPVDGNPEPRIEWYNKNTEAKISSEKQLEANESGCYTCVANNSLGTTVNVTQCLTIINASPTTVPPSPISPRKRLTYITFFKGEQVKGTIKIQRDYPEKGPEDFVIWFEGKMDRRCGHFPWYIRSKVTNLSRGSVIVEFILYIKTAEAPENRIEKLKAVISVNGTFGRYKAGDLVLLTDEGATFTTGGSTKPTVSAGPPWAVIGAVGGGVVLLVILVGVLTWWVQKQRKCRKDTKIHNSDLGRQDNEGGYSQVQGAYAQSGPPAANGTDGAAEQEIEVAGAIPTYAIVDKSKKSKKQADENPPEYAVVDKSKKKEKQEAAAIPTYAAVDKSKKKKKSREELPPVYAEVDTSKKKKKKIDDKNLYETLDEPKKEKKPGELLYADLGDFQNPAMPTVCISPQPLPAIKKADPYERTDYADITQFLKGNTTLPPNDGDGDTEMKPKRPSKKNIQGNDKETPI